MTQNPSDSNVNQDAQHLIDVLKNEINSLNNNSLRKEISIWSVVLFYSAALSAIVYRIPGDIGIVEPFFKGSFILSYLLAAAMLYVFLKSQFRIMHNNYYIVIAMRKVLFEVINDKAINFELVAKSGEYPDQIQEYGKVKKSEVGVKRDKFYLLRLIAKFIWYPTRNIFIQIFKLKKKTKHMSNYHQQEASIYLFFLSINIAAICFVIVKSDSQNKILDFFARVHTWVISSGIVFYG